MVIERLKIRSPRRRRIVRFAGCCCLLIVVTVVTLIARPVSHVLSVMWRDNGTLEELPAGFADDASRLNRTAIAERIEVAGDSPEAERQIRELLKRAAAENLKVSIAGARHTMGGHTIYPSGIVLDMSSFDGFELDESQIILHAQAGARWDEIIPYLDQRGFSIEIMQSNNSFTVGGSISANCHGWQPNRPPIASTVESFRLLKSDGEIVRCSRTDNRELFSLALGGYGLFGVILDVELRVVSNQRYRMQRAVIHPEEFASAFERDVRGKPNVGMAYGRLCVDREQFLEQMVFNVFMEAPSENSDIPPLGAGSLVSLKRAVFRGSADSDYGKKLRWEAELMLSDRLSKSFVSRNQLLNDPVELYQNRDANHTDILHEYFVPPPQFAEFVQAMRDIIPQHSCDLLNVTVRHVQADEDTKLCYADQEMFALVLLFNQERTADGEAKMQDLSRALIDAALELGGRHYLPYRLHATQEQFERAYPQAREFFNLKQKYDPVEIFQNAFYTTYSK